MANNNQNRKNTRTSTSSNKETEKQLENIKNILKENTQLAEDYAKNIERVVKALSDQSSLQQTILNAQKETLRYTKDLEKAQANVEESAKNAYTHYKNVKKELEETNEKLKDIENRRIAGNLDTSTKELEKSLLKDKDRLTSEISYMETRLSNPNVNDSVNFKKDSLQYRIDTGQASMGDYVKNFFSENSGGKGGLSAITSTISSLGGIGSTVTNLLSTFKTIAGPIGIIANVISGIFNIVGAINKKMDEGIKKALEGYGKYQGMVDSRLQGLEGINYEKITLNFADQLGMNPFIKTETYLENISELTQKGVAYNLEQRALISSIGDRLVSTFEVANENLLQLIRLQQADMTYSQAGAEAQLTQLLNTIFTDTSYLSDMYDTVSAALLDANSTMNRDQVTSFNYAVQKWLGALYSVGMSSSAVQTIAQGLNMLGSGDVSALTGDTGLNTLLSMSASRAGLSYSQLLTTGLTGNNVDELMEAMVGYLQDIANNTSNQVTKQAFTDVLNLTMTDLRAVSNLSQSDIETISRNDITYGSAMDMFNQQLDLVESRTNIAQQWETAVDNAIYSFGSTFVADEEKLGQWLVSNALKDLQDIVGVSITDWLGSFGDFFVGIWDFVTKGSAAIDWLDKIQNSFDYFLGGASPSEYLSLLPEEWEYTKRGGLFEGVDETGTSGVSSGVSGSTELKTNRQIYIPDTAAVGNSAQQQALLGFADQATFISDSSTIVRDSSVLATERTISDLYAQLFEAKTSIRVIISQIESTAGGTISGAIYDSIDGGKEDSLVQTTRDIKKTLDEKMLNQESLSQVLSKTIYQVRGDF